MRKFVLLSPEIAFVQPDGSLLLHARDVGAGRASYCDPATKALCGQQLA